MGTFNIDEPVWRRFQIRGPVVSFPDDISQVDGLIEYFMSNCVNDGLVMSVFGCDHAVSVVNKLNESGGSRRFIVMPRWDSGC